MVIGHRKGDIHDIGKDIVVTMLDIAGFDVVDLGVDVPVATFIDNGRASGRRRSSGHELPADESPSTSMKARAAAAEEAGLRGSCKLMIGGAPITLQVVAYTGADGFGEDAVEAVEPAKQWIGGAP